MNSKEALENIRDYHNETVIDNYCTYTENIFEKELDIIEKDLEILEKIKEIITLEASYVKTYSRYDRESIIKNFEKITEILNIDLQ